MQQQHNMAKHVYAKELEIQRDSELYNNDSDL